MHVFDLHTQELSFREGGINISAKLGNTDARCLSFRRQPVYLAQSGEIIGVIATVRSHRNASPMPDFQPPRYEIEYYPLVATDIPSRYAVNWLGQQGLIVSVAIQRTNPHKDIDILTAMCVDRFDIMLHFKEDRGIVELELEVVYSNDTNDNPRRRRVILYKNQPALVLSSNAISGTDNLTLVLLDAKVEQSKSPGITLVFNPAYHDYPTEFHYPVVEIVTLTGWSATSPLAEAFMV